MTAVAAGADDVESCADVWNGCGELDHRGGETADFVGSFALGPQRDRKAGDL